MVRSFGVGNTQMIYLFTSLFSCERLEMNLFVFLFFVFFLLLLSFRPSEQVCLSFR